MRPDADRELPFLVSTRLRWEESMEFSLSLCELLRLLYSLSRSMTGRTAKCFVFGTGRVGSFELWPWRTALED